jgi:A-kinase anchor protein 14
VLPSKPVAPVAPVKPVAPVAPSKPVAPLVIIDTPLGYVKLLLTILPAITFPTTVNAPV